MRAAALTRAGCLAFALTTAAPLHAQDADALLREGLALRTAGRDADALRRFEAAYALRPSATAAAQLGAAHQALGHWVDAERLLQQALADRGDSWIQRNRQALTAALARVARRLGALDVVGPAGAELYVDRARVGTLPLAAPLRVPAGVVTLELRAEGFEPATRRAVIEPDGATRESFDALQPVDAGVAPAPVAPEVTPSLPPRAPEVPVVAPPPRPAPLVERPGRGSVAGAIFLGLGALSLGVLVGAFAAERRSADNFNRGCALPPGDAVCQGLAADFDAWRITWAVALPVGLSLGALGAWLMTRPAPARGVAWGCAPAGASVLCAVRY